jgi:hypothetical protein
MGRPRKPVSVHLIQGTFRPHRHAHLLPNASNPQPTPPEPDPAMEALRDEAERWCCAFSTGYDFFDQTELDHMAETFLGEMREAWLRLGDTFLAAEGWRGFNVETPFCLWAFGRPDRPRRRKGDLETLRDQHELPWGHE